MVGTVILCAMAALFGFVFGKAFAPLSQLMRRFGFVTVRTSYGGVERLCSAHGGMIVVLAAAAAMVPFALINVISARLPTMLLLFVSLSCLVNCFARYFPAIIAAWKGFLRNRWLPVALLFVMPDQAVLITAVILIAIEQILRQALGTDLVPGVPAAVFAPIWISGSALLVLFHARMEALFGLGAAGALIAIQKMHRFPPQLALGRAGAVLVACLTLLIGSLLIAEGEMFAVIILGSFLIVDTVGHCLQPGSLRAPFEVARLRGEPETGLSVAIGSLAVANGVMFWSAFCSDVSIQMAVTIASLVLATYFRCFLVRDHAGLSMSVFTRHPQTRSGDRERVDFPQRALPSHNAALTSSQGTKTSMKLA